MRGETGPWTMLDNVTKRHLSTLFPLSVGLHSVWTSSTPWWVANASTTNFLPQHRHATPTNAESSSKHAWSPPTNAPISRSRRWMTLSLIMPPFFTFREAQWDWFIRSILKTQTATRRLSNGTPNVEPRVSNCCLRHEKNKLYQKMQFILTSKTQKSVGVCIRIFLCFCSISFVELLGTLQHSSRGNIHLLLQAIFVFVVHLMAFVVF